ncbi:MAG: hypothetical protein ACFFDN_34140 [Candidatus Hodarchaeota archaeon]
MTFIKASISGIISLGLVYIVPITTRVIQSLISSFPLTLGAKGILPAILKVVIALILWWILFLLFGGKKKK